MKVGDTVEWATPRPRGAGLAQHVGIVVEVVAPGEIPALVTWSCSPRNHESYILREGKDLFWPRVKWLVIK